MISHRSFGHAHALPRNDTVSHLAHWLRSRPSFDAKDVAQHDDIGCDRNKQGTQNQAPQIHGSQIDWREGPRYYRSSSKNLAIKWQQENSKPTNLASTQPLTKSGGETNNTVALETHNSIISQSAIKQAAV